MSFWRSLNFIDASSPVIEELILFHDHSLCIILGISIFVGILLVQLSINQLTNRYLIEGQLLESVWTLVPVFILLLLAFPSLRLLYLFDEVGAPRVVLKAVGYQWYWGYDYIGKSYESYITRGAYRLLEVDNSIALPYGCEVQVLTTSIDVIHSWALPTLGLKADAIPGRLNSLSFVAPRRGVFYGQCSEICGTNHAFMPIVLELI